MLGSSQHFATYPLHVHFNLQFGTTVLWNCGVVMWKKGNGDEDKDEEQCLCGIPNAVPEG